MSSAAASKRSPTAVDPRDVPHPARGITRRVRSRVWGVTRCGNIGFVYRPDEIVRYVRSRLPFGPPVTDHGSPLPFVPRAPSLKPILPVADMDAAIDFYRGLAFEVNAYDDGYAWVKHCGWEYLHLRRVDGLDPAVNEASAYIHVSDAEQWHAALVGQSSTDVVGELVDQPWGMREFSIVDPAGNLLRFGQHL